MKSKYLIVLFALLSLALVCFIFGNSFQNAAVSNKVSGAVAQTIAPVGQEINSPEGLSFHKLVRKLAHFVEFAALGFCLGGLFHSLRSKGAVRFFGPAAAALIVAVLDESIQIFNGRNASVKDVLLDFSGAVFGLAVLSLLCWLILCIRSHKKGETQ